jgi:hypothetical protein
MEVERAIKQKSKKNQRFNAIDAAKSTPIALRLEAPVLFDNPQAAGARHNHPAVAASPR